MLSDFSRFVFHLFLCWPQYGLFLAASEKVTFFGWYPSFTPPLLLQSVVYFIFSLEVNESLLIRLVLLDSVVYQGSYVLNIDPPVKVRIWSTVMGHCSAAYYMSTRCHCLWRTCAGRQSCHSVGAIFCLPCADPFHCTL